jgi:organic hydroperoxide reductase OsmC/OhrA
LEPAIKHKTFTYHTALEWKEGRHAKLSSDVKPTLDVSSPPEFKGLAGMWTPEDMFVASAEICMMSTFLSFGGRKNIPLVSYKSAAEGVLEFVSGKYRFTKIRIIPEITVGKEWTREQVRDVVREAHGTCLIANSMSTAVEIDPTIVLV